MRKILFILVVLLIHTNCSRKYEVGVCCDKTYTNIEKALSCFEKTNYGKKTTSDNRLLLLAFVNENIKKHQNMGWGILNEKEVIEIAKQNYLLIILDVNQFQIPKGQDAKELLNRIKNHNNPLFFVITNSVLYPFAEWNSNEQKDVIVNRLQVGNGP